MRKSNFSELEVGDFFSYKGGNYRKILHAKSWSHEVSNIIYYNAVGIDDTSEVYIMIEDDKLVITPIDSMEE